MTIEKGDVTFKSADNLCSGWFFLPQRANADEHVPAIAMAHGVGAVKEMYIDFFARRFAEAGVAALPFDYRFFGVGRGGPRRRGFPSRPVGDCLSGLPEDPSAHPSG